MNTKLTLNIDDGIIQQAKVYAKTKKRSVSKLVEEYLYSISSSSIPTDRQFSPITSELLGMIKINNPDNLNYKELLESILGEKYL